MNEIRDLIVGIDFGREYSQICYYDRKAEEPRSISMKVGSSQFEAPTVLCKRVEQKDFCIGLEAEYFAREKGGLLIENLYGICEQKEAVPVAGETKEPWELLACFLKGLLKFLGVTEVVKNTRCLVISLPKLGEVQVENFEKACGLLGFPEEKYILMDYGESFYYYVLTQKRETWNRSVGWYAFLGDSVEFRRLSMNSAGKPVLVHLEDAEKTELCSLEGSDKDAAKRDLEFTDFVKKTLGTDLYSSIQITGAGFDQQWAKQCVKVLCQQGRKVFYGNNLFAKGACAAGKEKLEDKKLKGYRYLSPSLVVTDVGMDMRVMGSPAYYPLIEAGRNWYECKAQCELILDDTMELAFTISRMNSGEKKKVILSLPGLPKRPNKTTRLSLSLQYVSPKECHITVRDLGFGELFPTSGRVWKEVVYW